MRIVGILMLVFMFAGMFLFIAYVASLVVAFTIFGVVAISYMFIYVAVRLITEGGHTMWPFKKINDDFYVEESVEDIISKMPTTICGNKELHYPFADLGMSCPACVSRINKMAEAEEKLMKYDELLVNLDMLNMAFKG